jgi:hypothetical protein
MADNKKSDDKFIEQLAQLSLRRLINLNLNIFEFIFGYFLAAIGLILLLVFSFGIASLSSILLVGLVMGKSLPEIFDVWINMWIYAWDSLRNILEEFMYDILEA